VLSAEEQLYKRLKQLEPEVRRTMLRHGLSQEQRLALERWLCKQKAAACAVERTLQVAVSQGPISWNRWQRIKAASGCRLLKDSLKQRKHEVMKWRAMNEGTHGPQGRRRQHELGVATKLRLLQSLKRKTRPRKLHKEQPISSEVKKHPRRGVVHVRRRGGTFFQAGCQVGPFMLRSRQCACVHQAESYRHVLYNIRSRMRASSTSVPMEERFRRAIRDAAVSEDVGLSFRASIGARHWIGQGLYTPWYKAHAVSQLHDAADSPLSLGIDAWRRLAVIREALPSRGLSRCSGAEIEHTWELMQQAYVEIWSQAGIPQQRVKERLRMLREKHVTSLKSAEEQPMALARRGL